MLISPRPLLCTDKSPGMLELHTSILQVTQGWIFAKCRRDKIGVVVPVNRHYELVMPILRYKYPNLVIIEYLFDNDLQ